jgi:ATP-dependent Clp protease, protease subunit
MNHPAMRRLQALVKANANSPIRNRQTTNSVDGSEATIFLYDVIDPFWGVSAEGFVKELNAISAPTIHLRINSPGGDVFEARAIETAIRQHPSKIIAHVDGLAASAASTVALAAREVEIADGAFFMIHRAWTIGFGNAEDLMAVAGLLEKIDADIVRAYAAETGQDEEQIRGWVNAETWFNADESVEHGFADRKGAEYGATNGWDLSVYEKVPKALQESAAPEDPWHEHHARARRIARAL